MYCKCVLFNLDVYIRDWCMHIYPHLCSEETMKRAITICYSVSALASIINYSVWIWKTSNDLLKSKITLKTKAGRQNEQRTLLGITHNQA